MLTKVKLIDPGPSRDKSSKFEPTKYEPTDVELQLQNYYKTQATQFIQKNFCPSLAKRVGLLPGSVFHPCVPLFTHYV